MSLEEEASALPRGPHTWQVCTPPDPKPVRGVFDEETRELFRAATLRVWSKFGHDDKKSFHEFVCLGRRSSGRQAVVELFTRLVHKQAEIDQRHHAENAGMVLKMMDDLGVQTMTPQAGDKVTSMVIRVTDSMALGGDVPPRLALRRVIVSCSGCAENCWLDPLSHGEATPVPLCMRCIDPRVGAAIDDAISKKES